MGTQTTETPTPTPPRSRRGLLVAAATFAAIVLVVGALVLIRPGGEEIEPATTPPTTQALVTTTEAPPPEDEPFTADEALAVADDFFAAYGAGDFGALAAFFTADAQGRISTGGLQPSVPAPQYISEREQLQAWNTVQGSTRSPMECTASGGPAVIHVRCAYEESQAPHLAVGAPSISIIETLLVTSEGIMGWEFSWQQPDYAEVHIPFGQWMVANHPEDAAAAAVFTWTSVEEAEEFGAIRADYARQWAAYLIANGCTYEDRDC